MQVNLILSIFTKIFYAFKQLDWDSTYINGCLFVEANQSFKETTKGKKLHLSLRDQLTP